MCRKELIRGSTCKGGSTRHKALLPGKLREQPSSSPVGGPAWTRGWGEQGRRQPLHTTKALHARSHRGGEAGVREPQVQGRPLWSLLSDLARQLLLIPRGLEEEVVNSGSGSALVGRREPGRALLLR